MILKIITILSIQVKYLKINGYYQVFTFDKKIKQAEEHQVLFLSIIPMCKQKL